MVLLARNMTAYANKFCSFFVVFSVFPYVYLFVVVYLFCNINLFDILIPMSFAKKFEERWLFWPKVLYFVINLQYYTLHQFRSAFALEKFHVSEQSYGFFSGSIMFITFFTSLGLGSFSDKKNNHTQMLLFFTSITAVLFALFYIDPIMGKSTFCFWSVMLFYLLFNIPKQPLLDKIILDYISNIPSTGPESYGRQRLWGTLAYGAATYITEKWIQQKGTKAYKFENLFKYSIITTIISLGCIALFRKLNGNRLSERQEFNEEEVEREGEGEQEGEEITRENIKRNVNNRNSTGNLFQLFRNREFIFFIAIMFSNAITRSAMTLYLTIFHRDVLQIEPYALPKSWPGFVRDGVNLLNKSPVTALTIFGISFEVLVMFVSKGIIQKLGLFWPLLLAQLFALFRFMAYYMMDIKSKHVYGMSCVFELIKGIYFGLAHISAVQIATRLAPDDLKASSQMIYQGTFNALGSLVSGFVFGRMFDPKKKSGSEKAAMFSAFFLVNAAMCAVTIGVYVYKYGLMDRVLFSRQAEDEKLNQANSAIAAQ